MTRQFPHSFTTIPQADQSKVRIPGAAHDYNAAVRHLLRAEPVTFWTTDAPPPGCVIVGIVP